MTKLPGQLGTLGKNDCAFDNTRWSDVRIASLAHGRLGSAPQDLSLQPKRELAANANPGWKDNLLVAGLSSEAIIRKTLDGEKVTGEERIPMGKRVRDVQGPHRAVYALTTRTTGRSWGSLAISRLCDGGHGCSTLSWLWII